MSTKSNGQLLIELIDMYLNNEISSLTFEREYIKLWRFFRDLEGDIIHDDSTLKYFDLVFCAVDAYCSDVELRDDLDFDEQQLFSEVKKIHKDWSDNVTKKGYY